MKASNGWARPIAFRDDVTAWEYEGEVYLAPSSATAFDRETLLPTSCRWESSRTHWDRYWESAHKPYGWVSMTEPTEGAWAHGDRQRRAQRSAASQDWTDEGYLAH